MTEQTPAWLTTELEWGLHETSAPAELWDRVMAAQRVQPVRRQRMLPALAWAMAAAAILAVAIGLASGYRPNTGSDQALALHAVRGASQIGFHCQNPAELRAWVRADSEVRNSPHDRTSGPRFTLASDTSADFQTACKLCHLD